MSAVGALAAAGLVYTAVSWSLTPSSTHSLDGWRAARGDGGVLAACFASFVAWRIALPSHNPAVHLLHYVAATIALVAPRRRRSEETLERNGGVDWLLPPRGGGGWPPRRPSPSWTPLSTRGGSSVSRGR